MYVPKWLARAVLVIGIAFVAWCAKDAFEEGRSMLAGRAAAAEDVRAGVGSGTAGDQAAAGPSDNSALLAAILTLALQQQSAGQQDPTRMLVVDGGRVTPEGGGPAAAPTVSGVGRSTAQPAPRATTRYLAVPGGTGAASSGRVQPRVSNLTSSPATSAGAGRSSVRNDHRDLLQLLIAPQIASNEVEQTVPTSPVDDSRASLGQLGDLSFFSDTAMTAFGQEIVIAADGSVVMVGDNGQLLANTGASSAGGVVALGAEESLFSTQSTQLKTSRNGGSGGDEEADSGKRRKSKQKKADAAQWGAAAEGSHGGHRSAGVDDRSRSGSADVSPLTSPITSFTAGRNVDIAGYEDHSLAVRGQRDIVTYDDSNVFIDRDGKINSNTGDTDSAGLNAVDTTRSTVTAGPHCDDGCDDESIMQAQAGVFDEGDVAIDGKGNVVFAPEEKESASDDEDDDSLPSDNGDDDDSADDESDDGDVSDPVEPAETREQAGTGRTPTKKPAGDAMVIGGDGYDDLGIRVDGDDHVVTYDDSNVVIGGKGDVNAQIGDSDTGGTVTMGTTDSKVSGGNSR